jgi:hypothetical protein
LRVICGAYFSFHISHRTHLVFGSSGGPQISIMHETSVNEDDHKTTAVEVTITIAEPEMIVNDKFKRPEDLIDVTNCLTLFAEVLRILH